MMVFQWISLVFLLFSTANGRYKPTWDSLDKRPLPDWYDEAKLGIFMHWGVYSVPSVASEWFWSNWVGNSSLEVDYMKSNYKPGFSYADFGPMFTAEFFDAKKFAKIVQSSGAKYFVHTSKHHEGYTMWPSKYSWNWNSLDVGPHRDIIGELAEAMKSVAPDVKFGLYYSLFEWFHPLYLQDKTAQWKQDKYVSEVAWPQLIEIVNTYKPEVVWSDGEWEAPDTYWNSTNFLAWLYNESPVKDTVVSNDRWGSGTLCHHGGYYTCTDRYNPGTLQSHKWENCMTVDSKSWGFRRTMTLADVLTPLDLITALVSTVSCGGNLLLNVGPTHDGRIVPIFEERLGQLGDWLKVNGEAIYASKPWICQNDTVTPNIWYTSKMISSSDLSASRPFNPQIEGRTVVFATLLKWPKGGQLYLGCPTLTPNSIVSMMGYADRIYFKKSPSGGLMVDLSSIPFYKLPSTQAWVLQFENLATDDQIPNIDSHTAIRNKIVQQLQ